MGQITLLMLLQSDVIVFALLDTLELSLQVFAVSNAILKFIKLIGHAINALAQLNVLNAFQEKHAH